MKGTNLVICLNVHYFNVLVHSLVVIFFLHVIQQAVCLKESRIGNLSAQNNFLKLNATKKVQKIHELLNRPKPAKIAFKEPKTGLLKKDFECG